MLNKEENEGKQAGLYENKKNYYFTGMVAWDNYLHLFMNYLFLALNYLF